jgi:hypothetical protein
MTAFAEKQCGSGARIAIVGERASDAAGVFNIVR